MTAKLLSMTGYGEAASVINDLEWSCIIQSVNSRNLDVRFRMPSALHSLESTFRKQLQKVIARGKVDVILSFAKVITTESLELSSSFFNSLYVKEFCVAGEGLLESLQWQSTDGLRSALLASAFSQRDAFADDGVELSIVSDPLISLLAAALKFHLDSRIAEGCLLQADIRSRLSSLSTFIDSIALKAEAMPALFRNRIEDRLSSLIDSNQFDLDPSRLAQEIAHLIDKADVSEEIVRFNAHIQQYYTEIDNVDTDRRGKKLEFIVQEMLREINTIGSKANLLEITRIVVEVKNELEKIREQVQNIV